MTSNILSGRSCHYAMGANTLVIKIDSTRYIYNMQDTQWLATHGTFWLVSDVRRGSSRSNCTGHDVTGLDINLDFQEAQIGCEARLGSCQVVPDHSLTEKQAPAGELAGFSALGTRKACCLASSPCTGPAAWTLARLAMIATVVSKSVETDHVIAYCANGLVQLGLHTPTILVHSNTVSGKTVDA